MALITRISKLFTADVHAVLDRIEEPEVLLKQAVRDMEAAVAAAEQRLRALRLEAAQLADSERSVAESIAALEREVDTCFAAGEDGLARGVLKRKLVQERHIKRLAESRGQIEKRLAALEPTLEAQRQELTELRQKAELVVADVAPPGSVPWRGAESVTAEEVEVAFLREKQRRAGS